MKWLAVLLLINLFSSSAVFAVVGGKGKNKNNVLSSYNDNVFVKPSAKNGPRALHKNPEFVPYDNQERDFQSYLREEALNMAQRDEKSLCQSSNQDFLFLFRQADNFMRSAVSNFPGPLGTGVCWWLSDFQFNYLFLTYVNPQAPRPNKEGKKKILDQIISGLAVTELSGYGSLQEFMGDHDVQKIIKSKISQQYLFDSFIKLRWAQSPKKSLSKKQQFEQIRSFLDENQLPAPLFLDLKGPRTHALFALKIRSMPVGYGPLFHEINVLDTNEVPARLGFSSSSEKFIANFNWPRFSYGKDGSLKPSEEPQVFLDRPERYQFIKAKLDSFCKSRGFASGAQLKAPR